MPESKDAGRLRTWSLFVGLLFSAQAFASNPIQIENAKPGTSDWQLTNPATSREIEGYASPTSVDRGGTISFYVNASDPSYTIQFFRMGWYGGLGARRLSDPITQPGTQQVIPSPS